MTAEKKPLTQDEIRETIFQLHDYHAYKINGEKNPQFDKNSGRILDLKNPKCGGYVSAVAYYQKDLASRLAKRSGLKTWTLVGAVVPSHEAGKDSPGLSAIMTYLAQQFPIKFPPNPLLRVTTVDKLTAGGNRSKEVHLDSIIVQPKTVQKGSMVILLDDVSTSGNSIYACEELLLSAGAAIVLKIALAKTKQHE